MYFLGVNNLQKVDQRWKSNQINQNNENLDKQKMLKTGIKPAELISSILWLVSDMKSARRYSSKNFGPAFLFSVISDSFEFIPGFRDFFKK